MRRSVLWLLAVSFLLCAPILITARLHSRQFESTYTGRTEEDVVIPQLKTYTDRAFGFSLQYASDMHYNEEHMSNGAVRISFFRTNQRQYSITVLANPLKLPLRSFYSSNSQGSGYDPFRLAKSIHAFSVAGHGAVEFVDLPDNIPRSAIAVSDGPYMLEFEPDAMSIEEIMHSVLSQLTFYS